MEFDNRSGFQRRARAEILLPLLRENAEIYERHERARNVRKILGKFVGQGFCRTGGAKAPHLFFVG